MQTTVGARLTVNKSGDGEQNGRLNRRSHPPTLPPPRAVVLGKKI